MCKLPRGHREGDFENRVTAQGETDENGAKNWHRSVDIDSSHLLSQAGASLNAPQCLIKCFYPSQVNKGQNKVTDVQVCTLSASACLPAHLSACLSTCLSIHIVPGSFVGQPSAWKKVIATTSESK